MKKQVTILGLSVLLCGYGGKSVEKEGMRTYTNNGGEKTTARVKLKNDKIAGVEIDEIAEGGDKTKKELDEDYSMKQVSPIRKEQNEQIVSSEKYVEKYGAGKIKLNQDGKVENNDVRSSCTISVGGSIKAIQDAEKSMKWVAGYLRAVKQPMQISSFLSNGVSSCILSRKGFVKRFLSSIIQECQRIHK